MSEEQHNLYLDYMAETPTRYTINYLAVKEMYVFVRSRPNSDILFAEHEINIKKQDNIILSSAEILTDIAIKIYRSLNKN